MNTVEDTGERRRVIDHVSTDDCLELVCTLAYENALRGKDEAVIAQVETAMLKLRSLKHESTGRHPILSTELIERLEASQALYDPDHDPSEKCKCGHPYHRHFDSYENFAPVGCKYCDCDLFEAEIDTEERVRVLTSRLELAQIQHANAVTVNGINVLDHLESKMLKFAVELRQLGQTVDPVPGEAVSK